MRGLLRVVSSSQEIMNRTELKKNNTVTLRKLAREAEIPECEKLEREELIDALVEVEPEESKTSDLNVGDEWREPVENKREQEIRKVTSPGVEEGHIPVGSDAERMRTFLAKQPKVRVLIPLVGKEKAGTTLPIIRNGYRLNVMKGVYVDVPELIADIIMESQKQTVKALMNPLNLENPRHPKRVSGEGLGAIGV